MLRRPFTNLTNTLMTRLLERVKFSRRIIMTNLSLREFGKVFQGVKLVVTSTGRNAAVANFFVQGLT